MAEIDLISRADIEWHDYLVADGNGMYHDEKIAYKRQIDMLPSTQQWIPCSERLPERNGVYIVTRTISDGFEYGNITDACYFDGSDIWHDDTRINHGRKYLADVIAWMPLPEPYLEKEGDDE